MANNLANFLTNSGVNINNPSNELQNTFNSLDGEINRLSEGVKRDIEVDYSSLQDVEKIITSIKEKLKSGFSTDIDTSKAEKSLNRIEDLYSRLMEQMYQYSNLTKGFISNIQTASSELNKLNQISANSKLSQELANTLASVNKLNQGISDIGKNLRNATGSSDISENFRALKDLEKIISGLGTGGSTTSISLDRAKLTAQASNSAEALITNLINSVNINPNFSDADRTAILEPINEFGEKLINAAKEKAEQATKAAVESLERFDIKDVNIDTSKFSSSFNTTASKLQNRLNDLVFNQVMQGGDVKGLMESQGQKIAAYQNLDLVNNNIYNAINNNEKLSDKEINNFKKNFGTTFTQTKDTDLLARAKSNNEEIKKLAIEEVQARKDILKENIALLSMYQAVTGDDRLKEQINSLTDEFNELEMATNNAGKAMTDQFIGAIKQIWQTFKTVSNAYFDQQLTDANIKTLISQKPYDIVMRDALMLTNGAARPEDKAKYTALEDLVNRSNQMYQKYLGINMEYDTIISKAIEYAKMEEKQVYEGVRISTAHGYGMSSTEARNFLVGESNELYRLSNGQIGFDELKNNYQRTSKIGMRSGQDAKYFAEWMTLAKNALDLDEGTAASAITTLYKDLGLSAAETTAAMGKMNTLAKLSGTPLEQYVQILTSIAESYRKIGLNANDAVNVITNLTNAGFNAKDTQDIAQSFGGALQKFSNNPSQVILSGLLQGGTDPFRMLFESQHVTGAGWGQQMAAGMDTMLQMNRNMFGNGYMGDYRTLMQLQEFGFTQKQASQIFDKLQSGEIDSLGSLLQGEGMQGYQDSVLTDLDTLKADVGKIAGTAGGNLMSMQTQVDMTAKANTGMVEHLASLVESSGQFNEELQEQNKNVENIYNGLNDFLSNNDYKDWNNREDFLQWTKDNKISEENIQNAIKKVIQDDKSLLNEGTNSIDRILNVATSIFLGLQAIVTLIKPVGGFIKAIASKLGVDGAVTLGTEAAVSGAEVAGTGTVAAGGAGAAIAGVTIPLAAAAGLEFIHQQRERAKNDKENAEFLNHEIRNGTLRDSDIEWITKWQEAPERTSQVILGDSGLAKKSRFFDGKLNRDYYLNSQKLDNGEFNLKDSDWINIKETFRKNIENGIYSQDDFKDIFTFSSNGTLEFVEGGKEKLLEGLKNGPIKDMSLGSSLGTYYSIGDAAITQENNKDLYESLEKLYDASATNKQADKQAEQIQQLKNSISAEFAFQLSQNTKGLDIAKKDENGNYIFDENNLSKLKDRDYKTIQKFVAQNPDLAKSKDIDKIEKYTQGLENSFDKTLEKASNRKKAEELTNQLTGMTNISNTGYAILRDLGLAYGGISKDNNIYSLSGAGLQDNIQTQLADMNEETLNKIEKIITSGKLTENNDKVTQRVLQEIYDHNGSGQKTSLKNQAEYLGLDEQTEKTEENTNAQKNNTDAQSDNTDTTKDNTKETIKLTSEILNSTATEKYLASITGTAANKMDSLKTVIQQLADGGISINNISAIEARLEAATAGNFETDESKAFEKKWNLKKLVGEGKGIDNMLEFYGYSKAEAKEFKETEKDTKDISAELEKAKKEVSEEFQLDIMKLKSMADEDAKNDFANSLKEKYNLNYEDENWWNSKDLTSNQAYFNNNGFTNTYFNDKLISSILGDTGSGAVYSYNSGKGENGYWVRYGNQFYNTGSGEELKDQSEMVNWISSHPGTLTYVGQIEDKTAAESADPSSGAAGGDTPPPGLTPSDITGAINDSDLNKKESLSGYFGAGQLLLTNEAFHNSSYLNHVTDSSMDWGKFRSDMDAIGGGLEYPINNAAASILMREKTGDDTHITSSIANVDTGYRRNNGQDNRLNVYVTANDEFDVRIDKRIDRSPVSEYTQHSSSQFAQFNY